MSKNYNLLWRKDLHSALRSKQPIARASIDPPVPYLLDLTLQLGEGVAKLSEQERELHRQFFMSRQQPNGGFAGREGGSDLYYNAFALRGLALLGEEDPSMAQQAAAYLREQLQKSVSVIDLISLVFAANLLETWTGIATFEHASPDWPQQIATTLEQLRRPDGGYAKTSEGHASSTYQTFLIALVYEILELPLPDPARAVAFILGQQREDGGFVEISVMRRSGTNPTAAAVGALRVIGANVERDLFTTDLQQNVAEFLLGVWDEGGGFRANTQIPIADLLSTYTGLQTLWDLGCWDQVESANAIQYVRALQHAEGGFHAAIWDEAVDVEYSFYGIASLGLLFGDPAS
ncbi:MAG: terpene cyclase/mutase family protein [Planctomycetes bacterium]|nr:terpene cyclase/mutase family protein [Planctomycetota bacterium]